jgi:hypothetical protein
VVSQRLRLITRVLTPRSHAILHATLLSRTADKRFLRLNSPLERHSSAPIRALRNTPRIKERLNELLRELGDRTRIKLEWIQQTIAPLLEVDPVELSERSDPADPTRIRLRLMNDLPAHVRKSDYEDQD